ncbi:MAG: glycerophosphoryl diester phosphodiesterase membrane domain-containing protein [Verrucomicrobiota bacterium]
MQRYWLYQEQGAPRGPYEATVLLLMEQQGLLRPGQRLQQVMGGEIISAEEVLRQWRSTAPEQAGPAALQLGPLSTAELLDRTFEFCRQHFLQLFLFGCMAHGLISFSNVLTGFLPHNGTPLEAFLALVDQWPLLLAASLLWLAGVVVLLLMQGGLTFLAAETYLGRPKSIRQSLASIPRRAWPVLATVLLKSLLLGLAFSLIIIAPAIASSYVKSLVFWQWVLLGLLFLASLMPGLVLLVRWFLTMPAVMLEGKWGWSALRRSSQLITHRQGGGFWQLGETRLSIVLLVLFVVSVLLILASYLPVILDRMLPQQGVEHFANVGLLASVLEFLVNSLLMPLYTVATTLFYLDLRMRREGLDLELYANQLTRERAS